MNLIIRNNLHWIVAFINFVFNPPPEGAVRPYDWFNRDSLVMLIAAAAAIICILALTFVLVPVHFKRIQLRMFSVPFMGISLLGLLILDGKFSSIDGLFLLLGFVLSIVCLLQQQKEWLATSTRRIAILFSSPRLSRIQTIIYSVFSAFIVICAGEIFIKGGDDIVSHFKLSNGIFGLTLPAFLVILREFTVTRSAYFRNRILITPANVAGFVLAFFLFDSAVFAIWQTSNPDMKFIFLYLPITVIGSGILCSMLLRRWICRLFCGCLIAMYCGYVLTGYFMTL